ncbi:MAG TPA: hypothetical protein VFJ52_09765 [Terriglobia bacterium]|nr:hypothetical protein [Terriglobia bacterium]
MAEIVQLSQSGRSNGSSRSRYAPAILIVVLLAVLAAIAPFLVKYRDAPATLVADLQAMSAPRPQAPTTDMQHSVWVNRRSGLYYCRESKFYGKMQPGIPLQQGSALLKGFRPAGGEKCP